MQERGIPACGPYLKPSRERNRQARNGSLNGEASQIFAFRLLPIDRILPNPQMAAIKIPDATLEIVAAYALSDEQALLAKV